MLTENGTMTGNESRIHLDDDDNNNNDNNNIVEYVTSLLYPKSPQSYSMTFDPISLRNANFVNAIREQFLFVNNRRHVAVTSPHVFKKTLVD